MAATATTLWSQERQAFDEITISSYRLDGFTAGDAVRGESIRRQIAEVDPEILCVHDIADESAFRYLADSILTPLGLVGAAEFDGERHGFVAIFHDPARFTPGSHAVQIEEDDRDHLVNLYRHDGSGDTIMVATVDWVEGMGDEEIDARRASGNGLREFVRSRSLTYTDADLLIVAGDLNLESEQEDAYQRLISDDDAPDLYGDPLTVESCRRPLDPQTLRRAERSDRILLSRPLLDRYMRGSYTFGAMTAVDNPYGCDGDGRAPVSIRILMPMRITCIEERTTGERERLE